MKSLRVVLLLNAASCLGFGALFVLWQEPVASFLGAAPLWLVPVIGVGLAINGVHLVWAACRVEINSAEVLYFSAADLLWVTASLLLIGAEIWITTSHGIIASLVVAAGVGALGLMQVVLLERSGVTHMLAGPVGAEHQLPSDLPAARAVALAWLSMKTWVKVWLLVVNAAFLGALAFWPAPLAKLVLAAYLASGPWLAAIAIAQRGLTRLLGIAHLIPWTPLLLVLLVQLSTGAAVSGSINSSGMLAYLLVLAGCVAACLLLDVVDVWRWAKGERYTLGSKAAHRVGASKLAAT